MDNRPREPMDVEDDGYRGPREDDRRPPPVRAPVAGSEPVIDDSDDELGPSDDRSGGREHHGHARREQPLPARVQPCDEYTWQVAYDRVQRQYVGSVLEFPEVSFTGTTRDIVMHELEDRVDEIVEMTKRRGDRLPEPVILKHYPEGLDLHISQSLFRKLDVLSRHEKISIDQLVVEILSSGVDRRFDAPAPKGQHVHQGQGQAQGHGGGRPHQGQGQGQHSRQGSQRGGQSMGRRGYHESLENKENFLEYVRNLEKSGGGAGRGGGWRKK